jgi:hypothetical protein
MKKLLLLGMGLACAWAQDSKPTLAIVSPVGSKYDEVFQGLQRELGDDYSLQKMNFVLGKDKKIENTGDLLKSIKGAAPKAVIAMDNSASEVIREMRKSNDQTPAFAAMMLQVDKALEGVPNVAGIKFEIPAFTQFSNLKYVSASKFSKVAVFHRKGFLPMMAQAKDMLAKENLTLDAYCLDCEKSLEGSALTDAMKTQWKKWESDKEVVLWLLADNVLLTPQSLKDFWLPSVGKSERPVVAPLDMFVSGNPPVGEIGLLAFNPDYVELGAQLSEQIRAVIEDEEEIQEKGFEELISVFGVLNKKKAKKIDWNLQDANLGRLQKVVE